VYKYDDGIPHRRNKVALEEVLQCLLLITKELDVHFIRSGRRSGRVEDDTLTAKNFLHLRLDDVNVTTQNRKRMARVHGTKVNVDVHGTRIGLTRIIRTYFA
jgi:hypothetical protein